MLYRKLESQSLQTFTNIFPPTNAFFFSFSSTNYMFFLCLIFTLILCVCVCACVLIAQLCPTLCDPMDCSPRGFSVHGILQARVLEWVAISFSILFSIPSLFPVHAKIFGLFANCFR